MNINNDRKYHKFICKECKRELNGFYTGECPYCKGIVEAQVWKGEYRL